MHRRVSDEDLLRRFVKGEREALAELASRHEAALLGLARGLVGCPAAARDVVQETWVRVIRHGASFNGRSSFRTWVYRIAINRCRSMRGRPRGPVGPAAVESQSTPARCYHDGVTHRQAADILEIPIGTLKSRLHAALTELRSTLGPPS